jgi:transposase
MNSIGIDISAKKLDVALLSTDGKRKQRKFDNTPKDIGELIRWIRAQGECRVTMEATGVYHLDLAFALNKAGIPLMVVNPRQARRFVEAMARNQQTDASDAADLAEFGARMDFAPWKAPSANAFALHKIGRGINLLTRQHNAFGNRLHAAEATEETPREVVSMFHCLLRALEKQRAKLVAKARALIAADLETRRRFELLLTVKGIAETSAVAILSELIVLPEDLSAKAWVKYAGLDPMSKQSGSSVNTKPRISRRGNARLRAALYMPAMTAARHDPHLKTFVERLETRGKDGKQPICAVSRKLLHGIHAMFRNNLPWDSQRLVTTPKTA